MIAIHSSLARAFAMTALAVALAACEPAKPPFNSTDITGAAFPQTLQVTDAQGKPRQLSEFAGKVVVLFFGYTQCPDVCPTTLAEMVEVKKQLGSQGDKLQVLFVSVDPERDTPEVLTAYMQNFDPSFVALRPTEAELPALAQAFKVYYKKVDGKTPTSYTMDHTAASYVYDPKGQLRLFHRYGAGANPLTPDIQQLLQGR